MKAIGDRQNTKFKLDASLHGVTLKDDEKTKVKLSKEQDESLEKAIAKRMEAGRKK